MLFASVDPEAAEARGVPVRRLVPVFLLVLALTVTGAAQVVGTLLVLSLAITLAAAAQRLSARPLAVAALSVVFALIAADGGLLASFGASDVKASMFITSISLESTSPPASPGRCCATAAARAAAPARATQRTPVTCPGRGKPAPVTPRRRRAARRKRPTVTSRPDSAGPAIPPSVVKLTASTA